MTIRSLNGVYPFVNQRYIRKDKTDSCSFLQSVVCQLGQSQGFQSKGLLEYMSYYCCYLSYTKVSELLARNQGKRVYTGSQIQHKVLALRPVIEASETVVASRNLGQSSPSSLQLSFNFRTSRPESPCCGTAQTRSIPRSRRPPACRGLR